MSTTKWREGLQYDLDITLDDEKYRFEWADWLEEIGADTLLDAVITVEAGLVATGKSLSGTHVDWIFSCDTGTPPTVGDILKATCQAQTGGGQNKARSIQFKVVDKQ